MSLLLPPISGMRKKPLLPEETEKGIQKATLDWLYYQGFYAFRFNSGAIKQEYKGKSRIIRLGKTGMPDILAVKDGKFFGFEIKNATGKLTQAQQDMHETLKYYGAKVYVIRSTSDLDPKKIK